MAMIGLMNWLHLSNSLTFVSRPKIRTEWNSAKKQIDPSPSAEIGTLSRGKLMMYKKELINGNIGRFWMWIVPTKWDQIRATERGQFCQSKPGKINTIVRFRMESNFFQPQKVA